MVDHQRGEGHCRAGLPVRPDGAGQKRPAGVGNGHSSPQPGSRPRGRGVPRDQRHRSDRAVLATPLATPRTKARRPKLQRWLLTHGRTPSTSTHYSGAAIQTSAIRTTASRWYRSGNQGWGSCCHCRTGRLPWRQLLHARGDGRSGTTSPTPSHLRSGVAADLSAGPL